MKTLFLGITMAMAAPVFAAKAPPSSPELIAKGQGIYKSTCAVCHGEKGDGNGPAGGALNPKARNFLTEKFKYGSKPEEVFKLISQGSKNTSMASFAHLPEADRWALTYYVLSLKKK